MSLTRLLHLLTIASLMLMPLSMRGGQAMAAEAAPAAMAHCGDAAGKAPRHHSLPDTDCMAACAAIPAAGNADIAAPIPFPVAIEPSPAASLDKGLGPEAAIPPPRIS